MKKPLLLLIGLLLGNFGIAQVSDIVQQTWYLRNVKVDNSTNYVPQGEEIQLNFSGTEPNYGVNTNGVVNTFMANANFIGSNLTLSDIQVSSSPCNSSNCDFENLYFYGFLSNQALEDRTFTYFYMIFSSGRKSFRLTDAAGNRAEFTDQPLEELDEALFQTWYLHAMEYDLGGMDFIANFDPPIAPTLTINPDLSYSGFGSCNQFTGNFGYSELIMNGPVLISQDFQATEEICQFHNDFEEYYFSQFRYPDAPLYFYVSENPDTGNASFSFETMPGFYFHFQNYPVLSIPDKEKDHFLIFPNPVTDKLSIKSSERNFSFSITDINGRMVMSNKRQVLDEVDVSDLKAGMYFIRVESSSGNTVKKFIKN